MFTVIKKPIASRYRASRFLPQVLIQINNKQIINCSTLKSMTNESKIKNFFLKTANQILLAIFTGKIKFINCETRYEQHDWKIRFCPNRCECILRRKAKKGKCIFDKTLFEITELMMLYYESAVRKSITLYTFFGQFYEAN